MASKTEMTDQEVLKAFRHAGMQASYHWADDSTSEWGHARYQEDLARAIFANHPELQDQMKLIAKDFLWKL
jgi:hypothetical protein